MTSLLEEQLAPLVREVRAGRMTIEEATDVLTGELDARFGDDAAQVVSWPMVRRPEQVAPGGAWSYWLMSGGRGSGKTRGGAEWVLDRVEADRCRSGIFMGRTPAEVRSVMIEGESGFLACAEARGLRPKYFPTRRLIKIGRDVKIETRSAQVPDEARGGNNDTGWGDEFAAWPRKRDDAGNTAFTNLTGALRAGPDPRMVLTTTPKAVPEIKEAIEDRTGLWVVRRMPTWANRAHLPRSYIRAMLRRYGGTRLAAQEFEGLYIEDVEGALWSTVALEFSRVLLDVTLQTPPSVQVDRALARLAELGVVLSFPFVAVDPSVSADGDHDECGIVLGGVGNDRRLYVIGDYSGRMAPRKWAETAIAAARQIGALAIVAEANQGGALVSETIGNIDHRQPVELVYASKGKRARAEPTAILWDGDERYPPKASMVGYHPELEAELTGWDARQTWSPNRLDALAWLGKKCEEYLFFADAAAGEAFSGVRLPM